LAKVKIIDLQSDNLKGKDSRHIIGLVTYFEDLKDLRDSLVHYKVESGVFYDSDNLIEKIGNGIRTTGAVIKKIYLAHPQNTAYPFVFDEIS